MQEKYGDIVVTFDSAIGRDGYQITSLYISHSQVKYQIALTCGYFKLAYLGYIILFWVIQQPLTYIFFYKLVFVFWERRDDAVERALASHHYSPGLNLGPGVIHVG